MKIAAFFLMVGGLAAQTIDFHANRVESLPGPYGSDIVAGDFNNDGKQDVMVVYDKGLFFYAGIGNGLLAPPVTTVLPFLPLSFAAADFNQDGKLDLAVANDSPNETIYIFLGNGDGTFQQGPTLTPVASLFKLVAADFNGDGKPDLLAWDFNTRTISVSLGNGDGTFQAAKGTTTEQAVFGLALGDFNGDGKMDAAVSESNLDGGTSQAEILFGEGTGTFSKRETISIPFGTQQDSSGICAGSLIPHRPLDLVITSQNTYAVLLGNGKGRFTSPVVYAQGSGGTCAIADINGDGANDLVFLNEGYFDGLSYALGNGSGTFQPPVDTYQSPGVVSLADFNGDGIPDVATLLEYLETETSITILMGGRGGLVFSPVVPNTNASWLASGDFNGDGNLDLVAASFQIPTSTIQVLLGNGHGGFTQSAAMPSKTLIGIATGDFNNDGILDIAAAPESTSATQDDDIAIYLGKGDGTFQTPIQTLAGPSLAEVAVADFNGDGKLDIAVTSAGVGPKNGNVLVMLGNGDGTLAPPVAYAGGIDPYAIAVADLNGDGIADIVFSNVNSDSISILTGKGDGSFEPANTFSSIGESPMSLAIADLNGDGRPDIVVSSFFGGLYVFLNQGNGTFTPSSVAICSGDLECFPEGVAAADFNGDGIPDLAAAIDGAYAVVVVQGNGDGTFQAPTLYGTPGPIQVLSGRFLGHAHPDLAVASPSGVALLENTTRR